MSPPPEDKGVPEMSAKAAKLLGLNPAKLSRSKSERKSKSRGLDDDDDLVMVGGDDLNTSPEKSSRDHRGKSKVLSDPIFKDAPPPPAVPMPPGDDDLPIRRKKLSTMESSANARTSKQARQEDDIVMVDADGPSEAPGLKRSDPSARKAGIGGMLGGLLGKTRSDNKRRSIALTDDEGRGLRRDDRKVKRSAKERSVGDTDQDVTMTGGAAEEDQEARREARRARRAEKEATEKAADYARRAKDEERRERRRKQEEEMEARRQEEKEARRAARREQRAREDAEREAAEAKEAERAERRRARRAERDAAQTDAEPLTEDPGRLRKSDRRKSHMDAPIDDDEERRRRREERRGMRSSEAPRTSRRKSAPVVDSYFDPRNGSNSRDAEPEYLPADGPVYKDAKRKKDKAGWPHSGTDSWVKDHSDAPPPPGDTPPVDERPADDPVADENARRNLRKTRRHSKYEDGAGAVDDQEERRRRRESRRQEKEAVRSSEGSQGDRRRASRRDSAYVDNEPRAPSAQGGLFSRFKKIAGV